jgi:LuxR family transcriptional regulator
MNSAVALPFHAGPELGRAINRTDFFRLLKAAAHHYAFDSFALARISEASPPFGAREIIITNVAERQAASSSTRWPRAWLHQVEGGTVSRDAGERQGRRLQDYPPDLVLNEFDTSAFLLIPLFTPEGRRYCVAFSGKRQEPAQGEVADILLDTMRIFDKFYEEILANEMSGRLTQRENEVVRWTSEGKTSAEIAIILGLSEHTVNSHIAASVRKLGAVNRVHMVAMALRMGLVS